MKVSLDVWKPQRKLRKKTWGPALQQDVLHVLGPARPALHHGKAGLPRLEGAIPSRVSGAVQWLSRQKSSKLSFI